MVAHLHGSADTVVVYRTEGERKPEKQSMQHGKNRVCRLCLATIESSDKLEVANGPRRVKIVPAVIDQGFDQRPT